MLKFEGKLPQGALLCALAKPSGDLEIAQENNASNPVFFDEDFEFNADGRVQKWRSAQGAELVACKANIAGTPFEKSVGLQFELGKNCGLFGFQSVERAEKFSLAMIYSRDDFAAPLTIFCLNLNMAKTWASVIDFGAEFALAQKKEEQNFQGDSFDLGAEPILLECEIDGRVMRLRFNTRFTKEAKIQGNNFSGPGDIYLGARNDRPGPANRLGRFYLHHFSYQNGSLLLSEPDADWQGRLRKKWGELQDGL